MSGLLLQNRGLDRLDMPIRPGQPHRARARLNTGMHLYDAEVLRVRARTYTNLDAAPPAFTPPANWPAARARRCSNCVPPSMISSQAASPAHAALILCVADELLPEEPADSRWAIKGGIDVVKTSSSPRAGGWPMRKTGSALLGRPAARSVPFPDIE